MKSPALSTLCGVVLVFSAAARSTETCTFVKPPQGWNSYDSTVGNGGINESVAKEAALFVKKHLAAVGYEYIVLDSGWFGVDSEYGAQVVDAHGRLIPQVRNYPSSKGGAGFRPLADFVHSLGLKFGFWIMGGIPHQAVVNKLPVLGTNYTCDQVRVASSTTSKVVRKSLSRFPSLALRSRT